LSNSSIGIFDSGVGGLTVFREVSCLMPGVKIIYLGDTARVPYGSKSPETVTKFSIQGLRFLESRDVELIVVACNTVSALSLDALQRKMSLPLVGVLKPGAEKALSLTRRGIIGVIGTEATIMSRAYLKVIKQMDSKVKVLSRSCPLLVPLIEEGWLDGEVTRKVVWHYLKPLMRKRIDTLILGCTHYPMVKRVIQELTGDKIKLVDSAREVALKVKENAGNPSVISCSSSFNPEAEFFVTDRPRKFSQIGKMFLGYNINGKVRKIILE